MDQFKNATFNNVNKPTFGGSSPFFPYTPKPFTPFFTPKAPLLPALNSLMAKVDKGTSTRIVINTVKFPFISSDLLTKKAISMLMAGMVGCYSVNNVTPVQDTIKLAEYLLDDKEATKWKLYSISPLALFNTSDEDLKSTLGVLMDQRQQDTLDAAFVYIRLLQSLIQETQGDAENVFAFIMKTARQLKNKRLYVTAKLASVTEGYNPDIAGKLFGENGDTDDDIQNLMTAVHCFVTSKNEPEMAMVNETSRRSADTLCTTKLVSEMCGAAYGIDWMPADWLNNFPQMNEELIAIGQRLSAQSVK